MAFYTAPNPFKAPKDRQCVRHGCLNEAVILTATGAWWRLYDRQANDGLTGIALPMCEEHAGGWKPWKGKRRIK